MNSTSETLVQIGAKPTPSHVLILTLAAIAALSGILIVFVVQITQPIIKKNKEAALKKAVFEVLPNAVRMVPFKLDADGSFVRITKEGDPAVKYYAGYDRTGVLRGVAVEGVGQGYADKIRVLFGYSPQQESIVGLKVLESKETPGLGDKIIKDPEFKANFDALDVRLTGDRAGLLHDIEVVKQGEKTSRWQIAAITGATISSKAIGKILDGGAKQHVPLIMQNLSQLEGGG